MIEFQCKNGSRARGESNPSGPSCRRLTLHGRMPLSQVPCDLKTLGGGYLFNPSTTGEMTVDIHILQQGYRLVSTRPGYHHPPSSPSIGSNGPSTTGSPQHPLRSSRIPLTLRTNRLRAGHLAIHRKELEGFDQDYEI
jgi:hypothetical protein